MDAVLHGLMLVLITVLLKFPFVEIIEKHQRLKVACLKGIVYLNGWISEEKMRELAEPMLKNQYGQYLLNTIDEMKEDINN